jgi:hypothetical protein
MSTEQDMPLQQNWIFSRYLIDFFFLFNLPNPSSCSMALGFSQPLAEISRSKVKSKDTHVTGR